MSVDPVKPPPEKNGFNNSGFHVDEESVVPENGKAERVKDLGEDEEEMRDADHTCKWGSFSPSPCQKCTNAKCVVLFISLFALIQGMVVNGFVNVVISNIERRFSISSTESGTIASCYDIASVLLLIPVTYFGGQGIKPRYLGIGVFILGLGSFVFTIPHFATDVYLVESDVIDTCDTSANKTNICQTSESISGLSDFKYLFFLGQLLHGAGATPLYTLGVTYLDENLPPRSSSFYVGIFYAFAILGPAAGYVVGGELLNIYTDFNAVDTSLLTIDPSSPKWVGAWWIGFLISGTLALSITLPISGFPRSLPGSCKYQAERGKEVYGKPTAVATSATTTTDTADTKAGTKRGFKDIFLSVKLLITNPTFMFLNFAAASEGILLSGFSTFAPKFIESQFSFSSGWSAQIMGFALIPAGGGGTLLGGFLVKRFNWKVKKIMKFCLLCTVISIIPSFIFFMFCENVHFAGVNVKYENASSSSPLEFLGGNLTDICNKECLCSNDIYNPVCGDNNVMYYSPCHAGCTLEVSADTKTYYNCSCISNSITNNAISGKCESSCIWLPIFVPIFTVIMFLTFITTMPALSATLRCLPEKQRSFGLGIQWIIARCLGSIPGPILFGKLIDITCSVWQNKCGERGSCYLYDNKQLSYNLLSLGMVLKVLSCIFFSLSLFLYKTAPSKDMELATDTPSTSMTSSTNSKLQNGDTPTEK